MQRDAQSYFRHDCCIVKFKDKIILYGKKCPTTNLWLVPLSINASNNENESPPHISMQQLNSIYDTQTQKELITYLHQCLFSPPKATLLQAIKNDQLLGFPALTVKQSPNTYHNKLQHSKATCTGHVKTYAPQE